MSMERGFLNAAIGNYKRDLAVADAKIDELRFLLGTERRAHTEFSVSHVALEAERDYLMDLLDKAHGKNKNPARQPAGQEWKVPCGPRKGKQITNKDKKYWFRFIEKFNEKHSHKGYDSWRDIANSSIYDW